MCHGVPRVLRGYQTTIKTAPHEALYNRRCRTPICWDNLSGEIQETVDQVRVIRKKMRITLNCQEKYADNRSRKLEFKVGDKVFLKVSPTKGGKRFGIQGKLSPKFIGLYEILQRVGEVAYKISLPTKMS